MPVPVIIDTDPGTDDALALLLALASPELAVIAVTVCGGNAGLSRTLTNATALVRLAGAEVPVYAGAENPLLGRYRDAANVHGDDGLGGVALPSGPPAHPGIASDMIRRLVFRRAVAPITLVGIGPATNLALALATEPAIGASIWEIVLMAGAAKRGNVTPFAEFNTWSDPEALAMVLASGVRVTLVPLELTAQVLVSGARLVALRARGGGAALHAACEILESLLKSARHAGEPLHDPCTIAWLLRPDLFTARQADVTVEISQGERRGKTAITYRESGPVRVLQTVDTDAFFALLGERLALLP